MCTATNWVLFLCTRVVNVCVRVCATKKLMHVLRISLVYALQTKQDACFRVRALRTCLPALWEIEACFCVYLLPMRMLARTLRKIEACFCVHALSRRVIVYTRERKLHRVYSWSLCAWELMRFKMLWAADLIRKVKVTSKSASFVLEKFKNQTLHVHCVASNARTGPQRVNWSCWERPLPECKSREPLAPPSVEQLWAQLCACVCMQANLQLNWDLCLLWAMLNSSKIHHIIMSVQKCSTSKQTAFVCQKTRNTFTVTQSLVRQITHNFANILWLSRTLACKLILVQDDWGFHNGFYSWLTHYCSCNMSFSQNLLHDNWEIQTCSCNILLLCLWKTWG